MKLPRLRSCMPSSSPAAAASPRPSNRRASHREQQPPPPAPPQAAADQPLPPATPRKENRMPPPATTTPRPPKTLSRTRSSLGDGKEERERERSVRESPRPPPSRFQPPRPGYGGGSGCPNTKEAAPAPPSSTTADADAVAVAAARSFCFHEQVVLAEIKAAAAAFAPEPFHLRRPGNNIAARASPPFVIPRDNIDRNNVVEASEYDGGDEIARSRGKPSDAEITGDSDTEPSYVFVKKDEQDHQGSPATTIVKESPVTDAEGASRESSESLYSNVQSSFSQGSDDLDVDGASAAGSPLRSQPPSSRAAPSTEELLEADAAMLRKKREEEDGTAAEEAILIPGTARSRVEPVAVQVQPPMDDAVAGLRRLMTFGRKNSKGADQEDGVSQGWPSGYSIKPRLGYADAASDELDNGAYVISPHALLGAVRSLQSFAPSSPAKSELKERALPAKSPRVHRSFFSFSPFKNRGN